MEEHFNLHREGAEQEVRHKIEGIFHPLFLIFAQLVIADAIWVLDVVKHSINADLDLLKKLVRPDLAEIEANYGLSRARVIRFDLLKLLMCIRVSYVG